MLHDKPQLQLLLGVFLLVVLFYFTYLYEPIEDAPSDIEQHLQWVKEKQKSSVSTYVKACKDGMIRGSMVGLVTGGPHSAIVSGIAMGFINPVLKYME